MIDLIHMICKGAKYEGGEIEMTPEEFFKFFVKYQLGVRIFDRVSQKEIPSRQET